MASLLSSFTPFTIQSLPQFRFQTRIRASFSQNSNPGVKKVIQNDKEEELEVLWDDGYGETTVQDYLDVAKDFIHVDGGPPRWFSPVDCGRPIKGSPLLLFLPGIDGLGLGLCLHHKTLGRVFEVRCLHIPVYDRTSFAELVRIVENTVRIEHAGSPDKPIYLVGDSFGGCLSLAVAARNPFIDLVLILVNPATAIDNSAVLPLFSILEVLPDEHHVMFPCLLNFIIGDPIQMASINNHKGLPPAQMLQQLSENLTDLLPHLSRVADIITKETLQWKLKMLKSGASYANSRLHAVKAEVLLLASGKDSMLPSRDEAHRLSTLIQNCTVRCFKDNGHAFLLEDGVHLLAIIKGTSKYRRSRRHDYITDYIPPSLTELKLYEQAFGLRHVISPVMLSTLDDGKIVRGLSGIPNQGPILFVGYHMLLGLEVIPLIEEFLREKKVMVRGMAHPALFTLKSRYSLSDDSFMDIARQCGSVPVTPSNLYRMLSSNAYTLLYPGGAREALHRKGEEYKLFWPEQPEFVRMAARFEATIVPFGVVGEDDFGQLVADYNDLMNIPIVSGMLKEMNQSAVPMRNDANGEVANQDFHIPLVIPKVPGRFYYLFGKPIETKGRKELLSDKESANALYTEIQREVESRMSYLKEKREKDPYRGILDRIIYGFLSSPCNNVPTFEP